MPFPVGETADSEKEMTSPTPRDRPGAIHEDRFAEKRGLRQTDPALPPRPAACLTIEAMYEMTSNCHEGKAGKRQVSFRN